MRFLESLHGRASELIMVGDVLDYWFEYRMVVPRGHIRFFGALARLADSGVKITWLTGNHDIWLFDYLKEEIGLTVADGPVERDILGRRFYISHGDREGEPTRGFRFIQWLFRNRFTQKLYSGIHPRWTVGFAHRWSSSSRDFANYRPPGIQRRRGAAGQLLPRLPARPRTPWQSSRLLRVRPPAHPCRIQRIHTSGHNDNTWRLDYPQQLRSV